MIGMHRLVGFLAAASLGLGAGAGLAAEPLRSAPLRVFEAGELTRDSYTVVRRLWIEDWRSAFAVPAHADAGAAIAAASETAAGLGAEGLTHLYCVRDEGAWLAPGYLCWALAIRAMK